MDLMWETTEGILASGHRLAVVTTGGGSQTVHYLLNHPGASRAVLEVQIPYCQRALVDYLAANGPHPVTADTARAMAARAFGRALELTAGDREEGGAADRRLLGAACTAARATRRQRRGDDRCWLALRTPDRYRMVALRFSAESAGRLEQEEVLSQVFLKALAQACGAAASGGAEESLPDWAGVEVFALCAGQALDEFFDSGRGSVERCPDGVFRSDCQGGKRVIFAGSFNPFHEGHEQLAGVASAQTGQELTLEISVANVDKPTLGYVEVAQRLDALPDKYGVLVTRAATFPEKARLFPGSIFIIGYDTAVRLLDRSYYGGGSGAVGRALAELDESGCSFLVAGRLHREEFRQLQDLDVPQAFRHLFEAIPESVFRRDTSSSELRDPPEPE